MDIATEEFSHLEIVGTNRSEKSVQATNKKLSAERKTVVDKATAPRDGIMSWSIYEDGLEAEKQNGSSPKTKSKSNK